MQLKKALLKVHDVPASEPGIGDLARNKLGLVPVLMGLLGYRAYKH